MGFPMLHRYPSFFFLFWVFGESRQFPGAPSSLRFVAGLEDVLDESCGSGVEDELVPESDDMFRLAENLLSLFGQVWLLTAGPLKGKSVPFAELA